MGCYLHPLPHLHWPDRSRYWGPRTAQWSAPTVRPHCL